MVLANRMYVHSSASPPYAVELLLLRCFSSQFLFFFDAADSVSLIAMCSKLPLFLSLVRLTCGSGP
jgi:hypothetical protein